MTTVADGLYQYGGMPVGSSGVPAPFTGKWWFVDPVNGADGNPGDSPKRAFATLYQAHNKANDGNNDVVVLIGNGQASGTARLSLANAQSINSAVTAGTLVWSKNALHLIGVSAPSTNPRARIAPPTGTYTATTFGSTAFVTVSGSGCYFSNISVFCGFSTGRTGMICWTDTGARNVYQNCAFQGMNDATSAGDAGSRSLKIGGSGNGEHTFIRCIIGDDTTARGAVANASLELTGGTPRNRFIACTFPLYGAAGNLGILGTGNACVDRWNLFEGCSFVNGVSSGSTVMTALASFTTNAPGGLLVFKDCMTVGVTKFGDTNALANSYVNMPAVSGSAGGLAVNPS